MSKNPSASWPRLPHDDLRLPLVYAVTGTLIIALGDIALDIFFADSPHHEKYDILADILVTVPITLLMIFFLLRRELSAREKVATAYRASEQRMANVLETAAEAIIRTDEDFRIIQFNRGAERIFGYRAQEALGRHIEFLIPEDLTESHRGRMRSFAESPEPTATMGESRNMAGRRKDGTVFPCVGSVSRLAQNGTTFFTVILHDIGRLKAAEEALRRSRDELEVRVRERTEELHLERDRLTRILDGMPDGIFIVDGQFRMSYLNPALERDYGPVAGRRCHEYLHKRAAPCPDCRNNEVLSGKTVRSQWDMARTGKTCEMIAVPITDSHGGVARLEILRDISERHAAEKERERLLAEMDAQRRLFQTVVHNATVAIAVFGGTEFQVKWANPAYLQILDAPWNSGDITGRRVDEIVPRAADSGLIEIFRNVAATGKAHVDREYAHTGFARGITYWQWSLLPLSPKGPETPDLMLLATEITEQVAARKRVEQLGAEAHRRAEEARHAYAQLETRTRELAALLDTSRQVASTLELKPLLALILDQLKILIDYTSAAILSSEGDDVSIVAYRGPLAALRALGIRVPLERSASFQMYFIRREPIIIHDLHGDEPTAREFMSRIDDKILQTIESGRALLIIPLVARDQLIGILQLTHRQAGYFTPRHAELAVAVANQAAIALENARLYHEAGKVAVLEERQRLARELHDSVSQAIYGIALSIHAAIEMLATDPGRTRETLHQALLLAQAATIEMRSLIFELRPDSLEKEGLAAAFSKLADAAHARFGISVTLDLCPEPALSTDVKEALYRICQEALWNTAKHARARAVKIRLAEDGDGIRLEMTDDGIGFDPTLSYPGHFGLQSMRERAAELGGLLEIKSEVDNGAQMRVLIPRNARRRMMIAGGLDIAGGPVLPEGAQE